MFANIVFFHQNTAQDLSLEVNARLDGNYSVVVIDTKANETSGLYFFVQEEEAIDFAQTFVTHWETLPPRR